MDDRDIPPIDEDDDYEFADHDPTMADCVRLWHQAIEWHQHDTLLGIREFAGCLAEPENAAGVEQRDLWIESVRRVRAAGLFDEDTAYNFIWYIVDIHFDANPRYDDDPELITIGDKMDALCLAHGLPEGEDFTPWPNPPAEWTRLENAMEARERELRCEVLRSASEAELARLVTERPAEFEKRMAVVEARITRDHEEERARWMPEAVR
jgi:hypothetical protein